MDTGSPPASEPSLISLLRGIAYDAAELLHREMTLTKLEVKYELYKAKSAAIALAIGVGTMAAGAIMLILMLVHVLEAFTTVPLWGCYGIVAGALVVIGGGLLAAGKAKAEEVDVVPEPTVARMKETAQWLTNPTTSDKR